MYRVQDEIKSDKYFEQFEGKNADTWKYYSQMQADDIAEFGTIIRQIRRRLKITQTEFCKIINVGAATLIRYEKGITAPPPKRQESIKKAILDYVYSQPDISFEDAFMIYCYLKEPLRPLAYQADDSHDSIKDLNALQAAFDCYLPAQRAGMTFSEGVRVFNTAIMQMVIMPFEEYAEILISLHTKMRKLLEQEFFSTSNWITENDYMNQKKDFSNKAGEEK